MDTVKTSDTVAKQAIELAVRWQDRANELLTPEEKKFQRQMARLLRHPMDKVVLTRLIDQSFRSGDHARVADQIQALLTAHGMPTFMDVKDKLLVILFSLVGRHVPWFSVPKMIDAIRNQSRRAIISGEPDELKTHLSKRAAQGVRMNINHLGEAVLGEDEAEERLKTYETDLANPDVEHISIKISTIYSQIRSLAFDETVDVLCDRLSRIYRAAAAHTYTRTNGETVPKFVNLDMEEYRDLWITTAAFMKTLDQKEFFGHSAGIALQAYLPDSYAIQETLTQWAMKRVEGGGAPIKLRIVKGANMEMELVDAALHNWPLAPYDTKLDVDANYKRMVTYGTQPDHIRAVHLGIASHNLFDLAYAYTLMKMNGEKDCFIFEMLEGMADHVRRAIQEISGDVLLYAPVATREQFINAVAYLIRRLDENTSKDNFLRYAPSLTTGSREWRFLENQFIRSLAFMDSVKNTPNRIQDRASETRDPKKGTYKTGCFENEADTDWSLQSNRTWAKEIRNTWMRSNDSVPIDIPITIAGEDRFEGQSIKKGLDPNQNRENKDDAPVIYQYALGTINDADQAVATAKADPDGWRKLSYVQRHNILSKVADNLRKARAELIGMASASTGKLFTETDAEVSEAIDFAEFYPFSARRFDAMENLTCTGKGVGLVISPWNFPVAIPTGGVVAALAAGNTVIFKPSSEAVLTAWRLCRCFWDAGISKNTLQFIPCPGDSTGAHLAAHPDIDFTILTGGTDTGMRLLKARPDLYLAAETGGKNATIVTSMSDRDQAVKNVIYSAFGNTGQKCSATSLLILEADVYDDPHFRKQLVDAAASLKTGSSWEFDTVVGPLVKPPSGDLKKGLTQLEPGEEWALKPEQVGDNPHMWRPGIKYGVKAGSYTHLTEFFGPILGVMRANNLDHAIELVNQTGYGLTSGLESLDVREHTIWKDRILAGNLYINRGTTGAIVLRQPFGGMGKSALGAGIKAGGPNYVTQFMSLTEKEMPKAGAIRTPHYMMPVLKAWRLKISWGQWTSYRKDLEKLDRAVQSYVFQYEQEFAPEKDYFHLRGQDNQVRYLPVKRVLIAVTQDDTLFDVLGRVCASVIAGSDLDIALPEDLDNDVTRFLELPQAAELLRKVPVKRLPVFNPETLLPDYDRIRYAHPSRVPHELMKKAAEIGATIARSPVMMEGRIELLHYVREQSICSNYHRYGNLGERGLA